MTEIQLQLLVKYRLHRAFDERQSNDYGEMLEPDFDLANTLFRQAQVFVSEIKQYLVKVGFEI